MFEVAVSAAHPQTNLHDYHLPPIPKNGKLVVVGAGKAALAMLEKVEHHYQQSPHYHQISGLVVAPDGNQTNSGRIELVNASHPLPDQRSVDAAKRILKMVSHLTKNDQVLVLLSGGASSLICLPIFPLTLENKRLLIKQLFNAGATIQEINVVRQHFSQIKGGKLAAACYPAKVHTLSISDVVGDQPEIIGSGPTVKSTFNANDIKRILCKYKIHSPIDLSLLDNHNQQSQPTSHRTYELIARPMDSLIAAAKVAQKSNYLTVILGDNIEGEAAIVAQEMVSNIFSSFNLEQKWAIISGGEVTVTMGDNHQNPNGGSNREFALALAIQLNSHPNIFALSADTDGVDGKSSKTECIAGAFITPTTLKRARQCGLDANKLLTAHQSGDFFNLLGDQVITGQTQTNVNDFRVVLIN